jgi:hypothetical protein
MPERLVTVVLSCCAAGRSWDRQVERPWSALWKEMLPTSTTFRDYLIAESYQWVDYPSAGLKIRLDSFPS